MLSKIRVTLVFLSGVVVAILASFLPQLSHFLTTRQQLGLSVGFDPGFDLSNVHQPQVEDRYGLKLVRPSPICSVSESDVGASSSRLSVVPSTFKADDRAENSMLVEATAAVDLAKEMINQGKKNKALKLLQHALALAPEHPDILNEYGEFLESSNQDIVLAEHMYCRALISSPKHSRALSNRKRTLPLVDEIDQNNFNRIDKKMEVLFKIPDHDPAMRRMKRESYFRHIYHTTAIEGNTFSLMQTRVLVETQVAIGGKSILEHQEILGMDAALSFINNSLVHRLGEITVDDIKDIHKRVLGFVDPIGAGHFRTQQVFVGEFIPPKATEISTLVDDFLLWINSEEALSLHPIELAALAHYRLVFIHPFYDGNGRTSRLLMNLILMQAGFPPVTIKVEEKHEYYKHLRTANNGDIRPFIRFIAKCTERTLDEYLWVTSEANNPAYPELITDSSDTERVITMDYDDDEDNIVLPPL